MHECPECGSACSCDMEDMWHESGLAVEECNHTCPLGNDDVEDCEGEYGEDYQ